MVAYFCTFEYLKTFKDKEDFSFKLAKSIDGKFSEAHNGRRFKINAQQEFTKMTILHYACNSGENDAAKYLIENGANRFIEDINGETPIFYAIKFGDNVDLVKMLLGDNEQHVMELLLHKNYAGEDIFKCAVQNGRISIVKYLLEKYFSFYSTSYFETLVNFAVSKNNPQILKVIIDFYGSLNNGKKINSFSKNVNYWRKTSPFIYVAKNDDLESLKILLEYTYIPNSDLNFNIYFEILKEAILNNATRIFESIKEKIGFEKMKKIICCRTEDKCRNTLLHLAVEKGNFGVFQELLQFFDNVQFLNGLGDTPMHVAAKYERIEIFKMLFKISSSLVMFPNKENETPLSIICNNKDLKLLISFVCENMDLRSTEIGCYSSNEKKKISMFQMSLSLAIQTKNLLLLENLIDDYADFENSKRKDILREGLKNSIKNEFFAGVEYLLLKLDKKHSFFRHIFDQRIYDENDETPFKLLILHMPDIAYEVLEILWEHSDEFAYSDLNIFNDMCNSGMNYSNKKQKSSSASINEQNQQLIKRRIKDKKREHFFISKTHPINFMIKHKRYKLLDHPLIKFYVDAKWNSFARWYHYAALIYQITLIFYASIILFNVLPESPQKKEDPNQGCTKIILYVTFAILLSCSPDPNVVNIKRLCLSSLSTQCLIFGILLLFLQSIAILLRIFQIIYRRCTNTNYSCCSTIRYIIKHEFLNFIILINFAVVVIPICEFPLIIQLMEILTLNIFIWLSLFNHLEKHPRLGVYITMLKFILKSFLRLLPVLIIILLPFVIKFFVVLKKKNNLSFLEMFVKILAMMYGDFSYEDFGNPNNVNNSTDFDNDGFVIDQHNFIKPTLFCLFLFIAIIFLNNLVLGLAITDVSKILEEAFIRRRILQIQNIHHIENSMPHLIKRFLWSDYCERHESISEFKEGTYCFPQLKGLKPYTSCLTKYFGLPNSTIKKEPTVENQIEKIEAKLKSLESMMEKMLNKLEEQKN